MYEFQYIVDKEWRVRVIFDTLRDKLLTKCNIKFYYDNELMYNGLGIAFCMPEDVWSDKEGRFRAFINAIKTALPRKSQASIRKELQREYVKYEKKWEDEIIDKQLIEIYPLFSEE